MKLFLGSTVIVDKPEILNEQRLLDFGKGFYTTSNQNQAERWATLKQKRAITNTKAIVSIYLIKKELFDQAKYKIKEFTRADADWLDFVFANRKGIINHDFDVTIGPVANDTLYAILSLYEADILTKEETVNRLKEHRLYDQIAFHTNIALNEVCFFDSYEI